MSQTVAEQREQNRRLEDAFSREGGRLRNFIRSRVADESDVEDILQEVFFELLEAVRLMRPIERVGAWLFKVAKNRIIDAFRRKSPSSLSSPIEPVGEVTLEDLLPSPEAGPEAAYARSVLVEELEAALAELPESQRSAFLATEVDGLSFKDLAAKTGVPLNTLLSRKHYAVLHLRERLRQIYEEFGIEGRKR